jgi:phosphatidylserine synthase
VITFGIAPTVLALLGCGFSIRPSIAPLDSFWAGYFVSFIYLLCGAARRPLTSEESRSEKPGFPRKYFVGLPIPAAAARGRFVVCVRSDPLRSWIFPPRGWHSGVVVLPDGEHWRYQFQIEPHAPLALTVVMLGGPVCLIWNFSSRCCSA